jgi:ATP diphosphatase
MPENHSPIERLLSIMARLRDPETGCPWDVEQNFQSIAPHTIEEAYEVTDAIERGDMKGFKEELGDLLLQVVFHAQMAKEEKLFDFDEIVTTLCDKLVYRHPHVFGYQLAQTAGDVVSIWDARKETEKEKAESAIDGVTLGLPALLRAQKLQKKAAKAGFVWPDADAAWKKLEEELGELKSAHNRENEAEEIGDVLFCIVNYARMKGHDSEEILRAANKKFERRFKAMEQALKASGKDLSGTSLEEKLEAWKVGKKA